MLDEFIPLTQVSHDALEALLDGAFGTDRHLKTAYSIRDGVEAIDALSLGLRDHDGTLVGSIQCWPVALRCGETSRPMVMVGPVAVHPAHQNVGIGRALMREILGRCLHRDITGVDALMLIGDPDYYGRWFGFTAARTGKWSLPGPVERHRLLALGDNVPDCAGVVGPRRD